MGGYIDGFWRILRDRVRIRLADLLIAARLLPYKFGTDPLLDIKKKLPCQTIRVIFDVGANRGDTAIAFRRNYPSATIYCFEPNPDLSKILFGLGTGVEVHTIAMSSKAGKAGFDRSKGTSDLFSLTGDVSAEIVKLDTVDNFCLTKSISHIDFLKIDTEGHDLEVLRGAIRMLSDARIDVVQAEVSMNPENKLHIGFLEVQNFLQQFGYRIFGIYEQINEWPTSEPNLRRTNVVYISRQVMNANKMQPS
jgi:FkbM family methyltransferase